MGKIKTNPFFQLVGTYKGLVSDTDVALKSATIIGFYRQRQQSDPEQSAPHDRPCQTLIAQAKLVGRMLVRPMLLQLNWDDQGFIDDGGASRAANVKSSILALLVSTIARLRLESKAANVNAGKPDWFAQITRTELADLVRFEVTKKLGDGFLKRVKKRLF